ncbi:hypothetical protein EVAR_66545_1 [Eumeta japonica]|uniref:Uncharacterized protein n=1 Tax=Eumeta variegata TaxID=151549 RepID=A0A4C2A0J5_EUMVA|nr:hypothetical protein EVAR_66545_1 [Eumeta japonica]
MPSGVRVFFGRHAAVRGPLASPSYPADVDGVRRPFSRLRFHYNSPIAAELDVRGASPRRANRYRRARPYRLLSPSPMPVEHPLTALPISETPIASVRCY